MSSKKYNGKDDALAAVESLTRRLLKERTECNRNRDLANQAAANATSCARQANLLEKELEDLLTEMVCDELLHVMATVDDAEVRYTINPDPQADTADLPVLDVADDVDYQNQRAEHDEDSGIDVGAAMREAQQ